MRRALPACVFALAACASAPAEPPAPAPEAPVSPERQRFERWKQAEAPADPRAAFARQAAAEAERRRSEALARGASAGTATVEAEMQEDQLAQLGASSGCFEQAPDLAAQDDWIAHRALTRGDFLAAEPEAVAPVVQIPSGEPGAYVVIRLACVVEPILSEPEPGRFQVDIARVEYLALLSRQRSWWNPEAPIPAEWILRHEQLHFDIGELFAQELAGGADALGAELRGSGADPNAALADFRRRFAQHIRAAQERFEELEHRYDRETKHGNDYAAQTDWFARVKRGLAALRTPAS
jgi:hypothetical protein